MKLDKRLKKNGLQDVVFQLLGCSAPTLEGSFVVFITYRSILYVCVYRDRISHPVFLAICCVVKLVIFLASMRG